MFTQRVKAAWLCMTVDVQSEPSGHTCTLGMIHTHTCLQHCVSGVPRQRCGISNFEHKGIHTVYC